MFFLKNTANENSSVRRTKQSRLILLSNWAICGKELKIKNSTILIIFKMISLIWIKSLTNFQMTGDKFMPELHLKQPGFSYSAFTNYRERIQKI